MQRKKKKEEPPLMSIVGGNEDPSDVYNEDELVMSSSSSETSETSESEPEVSLSEGEPIESESDYSGNAMPSPAASQRDIPRVISPPQQEEEQAEEEPPEVVGAKKKSRAEKKAAMAKAAKEAEQQRRIEKLRAKGRVEEAQSLETFVQQKAEAKKQLAAMEEKRLVEKAKQRQTEGFTGKVKRYAKKAKKKVFGRPSGGTDDANDDVGCHKEAAAEMPELVELPISSRSSSSSSSAASDDDNDSVGKRSGSSYYYAVPHVEYRAKVAKAYRKGKSDDDDDDDNANVGQDLSSDVELVEGSGEEEEGEKEAEPYQSDAASASASSSSNHDDDDADSNVGETMGVAVYSSSDEEGMETKVRTCVYHTFNLTMKWTISYDQIVQKGADALQFVPADTLFQTICSTFAGELKDAKYSPYFVVKFVELRSTDNSFPFQLYGKMAKTLNSTVFIDGSSGHVGHFQIPKSSVMYDTGNRGYILLNMTRREEIGLLKTMSTFFTEDELKQQYHAEGKDWIYINKGSPLLELIKRSYADVRQPKGSYYKVDVDTFGKWMEETIKPHLVETNSRVLTVQDLKTSLVFLSKAFDPAKPAQTIEATMKDLAPESGPAIPGLPDARTILTKSAWDVSATLLIGAWFYQAPEAPAPPAAVVVAAPEKPAHKPLPPLRPIVPVKGETEKNAV